MRSLHQDRPSKPRDPDRAERTRVQIGIIAEALGRDQVAWYSRTEENLPEDFEFLFHPRRLLVRDEHVQLVGETLGGGGPVSEPSADQTGAQSEQGEDERRTGLTVFGLPDGRDVPSALDALDRALGQGIATPDHIFYVTGTSACCPATEPEEPPSDQPVPALSKDSGDGKGVSVVVVDTGWHEPAERHPKTPWLEGVTGDPEVIRDPIHPYGGHGTFVAGVVRCVAPAAGVHVEGFLPRGGALHESAIFAQLRQAIRRKPDIVSMSAGTKTRNNQHLLSFELLWERLVGPLGTTVLVAAAGNDGTSQQFYPAALPWTVGVGSLDADEEVSDFSNYGSWVDVFALGRDTLNAFPRGTYICQEPPNNKPPKKRTFDGLAQWSGTSFSTPLVAGIIAARMSHTGESARDAADLLLKRALAARQPGEVAVMRPGPHNNT
jgi:subtilisin family serine protease